MINLSCENAKRLLKLNYNETLEIEGKFWKFTGTNYKSILGKFSKNDIQEIAYGDRLAIYEYSNGCLRALVKRHQPLEYSVTLIVDNKIEAVFGPWYADMSDISWMAHEVAKAALKSLELGVNIAPT